jgi:hypothetical protein
MPALPKRPKLLSGGNPQIPMGLGDAPVRAWLDAVPGWKQAVCRRIDGIIGDAVPGVRRAVKWNSPLYGVEEGRWFLSLHCFDRYVKVTFFQGAALDPPPAHTSKYPAVRYHHVREGEELGERFAAWVRQASALPGEPL